jgi:hypothetical protein
MTTPTSSSQDDIVVHMASAVRAYSISVSRAATKTPAG